MKLLYTIPVLSSWLPIHSLNLSFSKSALYKTFILGVNGFTFLSQALIANILSLNISVVLNNSSTSLSGCKTDAILNASLVADIYKSESTPCILRLLDILFKNCFAVAGINPCAASPAISKISEVSVP